MGVIEQAKRAVEKRYNNKYDGYNYYGNCNSAWNSYGRWILFAALVVGAFLLFFLFACITARRRRRMGVQPFYGTGWVGGRHGQPQYTNQQPYYNNQQYPSVPSGQYNQGWNSQPPPQYGQQNEYYSGQPKPNEYNGQQNGVELQQPSQAYQSRGGENVYQPPAGPPPGK